MQKKGQEYYHFERSSRKTKRGNPIVPKAMSKIMNASGGEYLESIILENSNKCSKSYFQDFQPPIDSTKLNQLLPHPSSPKPPVHKEPDYRSETALEAVLSRGGWLFLFFVGLIFAAMIIELFDEVCNSPLQRSLIMNRL